MAADPACFVQASKGMRHHFFALVDSLSALSALTDLELHHRPSWQLLTEALDVLGRIDGFDTSAIFLSGQEGLACVAVRNWAPAHHPDRAPTPAEGQPLVGRVAPSGGPLAEAVAAGEIRHGRDCAELEAFAPEAGAFPFPNRGSLLCAPVLSRGDILGAVVLHAPEPEFFELSHEPMLVLFCSVLGYVIDNHRLMQCMEDAVVERTAELSTINRQLEQEIVERSRAERHLKQARDQALEAVHVKGRFLANMSHELRTPLNGVLGMLQLLEATSTSPDQGEYIGMAVDSGVVLQQRIDEILDFSEVEAGKVAIQPVEFEPGATLRAVVDGYAASAREKGLEISTVVDPDLPPVVLGDPRRITQFSSKLVGNAVKFTEAGWIRVTVDGECRGPGLYQLRIEVADSGIGMSREEIDRVFSSFTQADGTSTRRYGGSGLGLAITKQLIDRMEGRISVESRPGEGSRFQAVIPCRLPAGSAPIRGVPVLEAGGAPVDDGLLGRLKEIFGADLMRAVDTYLESTPEQVRSLRAAVAGTEAEDLRRAARPFLAASRNLGARILADMCERLVDQFRRGDGGGAARQLDAIEAELGRVRQALGRFRAAGWTAEAS